MDTLNAYGSEDDDDKSTHSVGEGQQQQQQQQLQPVEVRRPDRTVLQAAPAVSLTAGRTAAAAAFQTSSMIVVKEQPQQTRTAATAGHGDLILHNNPTKAVLNQPVYGPAVDDPALQNKNKRSKQGTLQTNVAVEETTFAEQRANFQRSGAAAAPTATGETVFRTTLGYHPERLRKFAATEEQRRKRPRPVNDKNNNNNSEQLVHGSDDEAEYGVWAPPSAEEAYERDNEITDLQKDELAPEQLAERAYFAERDRQRGIASQDESSAQDRLVERKMAHLLPPKMDTDGPLEATTTVFHGDAEFDYKGRSWMAPPAGLGSIRADGGATTQKCFVPTKCIHRFTGHNKGVQRIRLFPVTGHLLLSAGLDGKCKVWSVPEKKCLRTYVGHRAAVRDVQFNHDGTKFVSASLDRYLRLWNTETGAVLQTFSNSKVPYVVEFYPHDDNYFVVGCSDSKIVTYNATTGEITQEYNHHLAPVNAILFVQDSDDDSTKMVTTSDDKKVLVWEWDIGVPVKYISDPSMHSMPCLVMHPSQRFFTAQSLDNTINVFQAGGKFALQRKKKFAGHVVSGYACEMCFSPDGQILASGDGNGSLFFWDWKKRKILQKYRAHSGGPAIACVWHPLEPSVMFTCGWDGIIKMWK